MEVEPERILALLAVVEAACAWRNNRVRVARGVVLDALAALDALEAGT